jgi:hypothetical protein
MYAMTSAASQEVMARLTAKFPGSTRVRRLTAMKLEAEGEFEEAISIYNSLLIDDPADTVPSPSSSLCVLRHCWRCVVCASLLLMRFENRPR